jgi:2-methylisocitrate lyase-like PEP mutase family enzyme
VRGYEAAGVQAIQIEDQEVPKKCGHTPGRRVVPLADAVKRIEVAVEARRGDDFLVVARTDARTGLGLDEAIRRARAFVKAGADILFVESPETEEEFARVGAELAGEAKLLANMVPTGRSPMLPANTLARCGFSIAIYPAAGMTAACAALEAAYAYLLNNGSLEGSPVAAFDMQQLHALVGFADIWEFERRHVAPQD